jgi:hypothetical protein
LFYRYFFNLARHLLNDTEDLLQKSNMRRFHSTMRARWFSIPGFTIYAGAAQAATTDGDMQYNAAVVLGLLGAWAVLMGLKNLRELRYRPLQPEPVKSNNPAASQDEPHSSDAL